MAWKKRAVWVGVLLALAVTLLIVSRLLWFPEWQRALIGLGATGLVGYLTDLVARNPDYGPDGWRAVAACAGLAGLAVLVGGESYRAARFARGLLAGALGLYAVSLLAAACTIILVCPSPALDVHPLAAAIQLVFLAFVVAFCLSFVTGFLSSYYPFSYPVLEVDIRTARERRMERILGYPAGKGVEATPVSRALPDEMVQRVEPDWKVAVYYHANASIHTAYHGAGSQIEQLQDIWRLQNYPPEIRTATARHLVGMWQQTEDYFMASLYLSWLSETGARARSQDR